MYAYCFSCASFSVMSAWTSSSVGRAHCSSTLRCLSASLLRMGKAEGASYASQKHNYGGFTAMSHVHICRQSLLLFAFAYHSSQTRHASARATWWRTHMMTARLSLISRKAAISCSAFSTSMPPTSMSCAVSSGMACARTGLSITQIHGCM